MFLGYKSTQPRFEKHSALLHSARRLIFEHYLINMAAQVPRLTPEIIDLFRIQCAALPDRLPDSVWSEILAGGFLDIWVPQQYDGLGTSLSEGLFLLKELARADGSLGWTVTLCSGANYFVRNLPPATVAALYEPRKSCFGGSGAVSGTACRKEGGYLLQGRWKYATGADRCTHFTMNASVITDLSTGSPAAEEVLSFVVPRDQVTVDEDWRGMGMVASRTDSFGVNNIFIPEGQTFIYNRFFGSEVLDRLPFLTFADLTLAVNYVGMAQHFAEFEGRDSSTAEQLRGFAADFWSILLDFADKAQDYLEDHATLQQQFTDDLHAVCCKSLEKLHSLMLSHYLSLGLRAANIHTDVNRCYRDYFTAALHRHFVSK